MMDNTTDKKTPLYENHLKLDGKMVSFAGHLMPVIYNGKHSGALNEHNFCRASCGLFDVSHMGEVEVLGERALEAINFATTNDASKIVDGQCQYTLFCKEDGTVLDDCIIYRFSEERFLICVNASNVEKIYNHLKDKISHIATVKNLSENFGQIAIQGNESLAILNNLSEANLAELKRYHFVTTNICGVEAIVSRTGYTGEEGYEIYMESSKAVLIWEAILKEGENRIMAIGLSARDTLRLEMGYPLYGHELSEDITPIEAGLKKFVDLDGTVDFIGKAALNRQMTSGVNRCLVGFKVIGRGIARENYPVLNDGRVVGHVTSGTHLPSLKGAYGMAFVETPLKAPGTKIDIEIRGKRVEAEVVKRPFYRF